MNTTPAPAPTARPIVAALEAAWVKIQATMPAMQIPSVVIVLASGTDSRTPKRGHFAPARWAVGKTANAHEVMIGGERLADGAEAVLTTLIHEAAHAGCHAQGIADTSRAGRYHNGQFKAAAEMLGATTEKDKSLGWRTVWLTDAARETFADELAALTAAITLYRHSEGEVMRGVLGGLGVTAARVGNAPRKSSNNGSALVCGCDSPRRIRVAASVAALGPIVCSLCGEAFAAEQG